MTAQRILAVGMIVIILMLAALIARSFEPATCYSIIASDFVGANGARESVATPIECPRPFVYTPASP
jgi:hypothetical protein